MSSLRGKSTRRKSTLVREDAIEIPEELISQNREIDLCIDIMYVIKCGFMTTIDQTIRFRSVLLIENCTHEEYYRVLDMVLRLYNSAGFHIKTICTRGREEQQNYQGAGMGGIQSIAVLSTTAATDLVFGANSSKSAEFIPSQSRNITVLQPKNHTQTSRIGLCQT
jgi:hypothetical protein